ncbi:hypothetical protein DTO166G4_2512 [Paecilomyces variotii]|uniref:FAD/NAD(P)-binding domain-containing protein n=1 Tax=Byssochlamys spectabilis TaxID=264951 RepID=A0A443HLQ7_BYSSP|nr:hypothetical protein C8Q69DRAFT_89799 [Paecilomyces variotii]KAJ9197905.1 hypothetical protein DTO164E3_5461 [Paecilomyces variotii]KAJ9201414.1 hypothetical protein DTO032I3_4041 [Paecilomyces variotii]KAJ9215968.1 hypothetical protein DTO166G4_2512 [Paecilomyces variotii]KAJ9235960.1 hypothetical protein DTO166G5_4252 [Paecilomyces variotii]KAJ9243252.1 hypothetical protein DTO169E5_2834 [Paecilomyces variotii]
MSQSSPPRILIVGAAYSGLYAALNLLNVCDGKPHFPSVLKLAEARVPDVIPHITILDERDGVFHTMGTPLVHVYDSVTDHAWISYRDIPALKRPNVDILQGRIVEIDPLKKTAWWRSTKTPEDETDRVIQYDYLIAATGLHRDWPVLPKSQNRQEYLDDAMKHINALKGSLDKPIVVVGGGAVGTEFAAEIKHHHPEQRVVLIHSRGTLLSNEPLPEEFKENTLKTLRQDGVEVLLETRVTGETSEPASEGNPQRTTLKLSNGEDLVAGHTVWATSRHLPRTEFLPREAVTEDGYVNVLPTLQFSPTIPNNTDHFAVGDITAWSGIKRVGRALSMGQCAAVNILQLMAAASKQRKEGEKFDLYDYPEVPPMMALALGSTAVTYHPDMGVSGGAEAYKTSFGTDLGLSICWNILGLPLPVSATA